MRKDDAVVVIEYLIRGTEKNHENNSRVGLRTEITIHDLRNINLES
jgi:hypothetical protein